ncbi:phage tail protein [Janthinobacterium aquaticum]|uniref:phage tail protein n=1 Tax=Janthinobacterium sp. FT58W TaxID=2654254 RepID=UPI00186B5291|nr:tail fiber protein [Janthinobacterium sp. FT58W]
MDPLIGTIMLAAFPFAPKGWMFCHGQTLSISTNNVLYAVLGVQFGGDGKTTFALPDLRGRIPVALNDTVAPDRIVTAPVNAQGAPTRASQNGDLLGANVRLVSTGTASIALTVANMPAHTHAATVSSGSATVDVTLNAALDEASDPAPTAGGYLATAASSGTSVTNMYLPALGASGSVALAKASGQVSFTPTVTNASTGGGTPIITPVTVTAQSAPTPPFLAMNYLIAVEGYFPMRN